MSQCRFLCILCIDNWHWHCPNSLIGNHGSFFRSTIYTYSHDAWDRSVSAVSDDALLGRYVPFTGIPNTVQITVRTHILITILCLFLLEKTQNYLGQIKISSGVWPFSFWSIKRTHLPFSLRQLYSYSDCRCIVDVGLYGHSFSFTVFLSQISCYLWPVLKLPAVI